MFNSIINKVEQNKINHDAGYYNCIPFVGMNRLEEFIPGLEQATAYLVTANSGIGKSKFVRKLFIHDPFEYVRDNPSIGIDLNIKLFTLEESKEKVILSEMVKYLFKKYGIVVSIKQLQSKGRFNTISYDIISKVKEAEEYINTYLQTVDIIENIRNPTGIYKYMRDFCLTKGTFYRSDNTPFSLEEVEMVRKGEGEAFKNIAYFKFYNPYTYIIGITDHTGLQDTEDGKTKYDNMRLHSGKYNLLLRDRFGCTIVDVQQQAPAKEQIESNFRGKTLEEKLEPSLDGLGDNKSTQQDYNVILGLFAPNRYNIENHNNYNILDLRDRYRSMSILKDRDGMPNKKLPLFFNGAIDQFRELPRWDDTVSMQKVANLIRSLDNKPQIEDPKYGYGYVPPTNEIQ